MANLFSDECQDILQVVCAETLEKYEAIKSGSITVEELHYINDRLDRFIQSIRTFKKDVETREVHVEQIVHMRMRDVEEFTRQQGQLKTFVNLCQRGQGKVMS